MFFRKITDKIAKMHVKLFNLNIFGGIALEKTIAFIQQGQFDLIHLQEVTGGQLSRTPLPVDTYQAIKNKLGMSAAIANAWKLKSDPVSYFGNATFYHPSYTLLKQEIIWMKPFGEIISMEKDMEEFPRNALALLLEKDGKRFWSINTHMAWSPTGKDAPHKIEQGKILIEFLQSLSEPFILSGDFNMDDTTYTIHKISQFATCLNTLQQTKNTLNPRMHKAKHLFPEGLGVDFIFASKQIQPVSFSVLTNEDLSDHLGLTASLAL